MNDRLPINVGASAWREADAPEDWHAVPMQQSGGADRKSTALAAPTSTGVLLAFIASYVDTVSFIGLYALFVAHVTGNFGVVAAALLGQVQQLPTKILALPVFVGAVAVAQLVNLAQSGQPRRAALLLLGAQTALLTGFMALGVRVHPAMSAEAPGILTVGLVGVFAMGLQNALGHMPLLKGLSPTTSMTGNLTEATMDLVNVVIGPASHRRRSLPRFVSAWLPILAFALGAGAAVIGFANVGFWTLLAPILLLIVVAVLIAQPA